MLMVEGEALWKGESIIVYADANEEERELRVSEPRQGEAEA